MKNLRLKTPTSISIRTFKVGGVLPAQNGDSAHATWQLPDPSRKRCNFKAQPRSHAGPGGSRDSGGYLYQHMPQQYSYWAKSVFRRGGDTPTISDKTLPHKFNLQSVPIDFSNAVSPQQTNAPNYDVNTGSNTAFRPAPTRRINY